MSDGRGLHGQAAATAGQLPGEINRVEIENYMFGCKMCITGQVFSYLLLFYVLKQSLFKYLSCLDVGQIQLRSLQILFEVKVKESIFTGF